MRATILPYAIIYVLTNAHRVAVSIMAKGSIASEVINFTIQLFMVMLL